MRLNSRLNNRMRFKQGAARGERLTFFTWQATRALISCKVVVTIGRVPAVVKYAPAKNTGGLWRERANYLMRASLSIFGRSHAGERTCRLKQQNGSI